MKKKILAWSDSPAVSTGFGVVSKHVLSALHNTGEYEIHHLAINHDGRFVDAEKFPWQIQPSKLLDPADPYGNKMFLKALYRDDYDFVWVLNDTYVTQESAASVLDIKSRKQAAGGKIPTFIYYFPIDCQLIKEASSFCSLSDINVVYTDHGREETLKVLPNLKSSLKQIPHGVDTKVFRPLLGEQGNLKQKYLNVGADTFTIVNVNRNSTRKQIFYTLLAFKEFRKLVPNSILYLHTAMHDQGGDLLLAVRDLGLNVKTDVIFPVNYSPGNSVPDETLNELYNMGDMYLTTHLGEGWGLPIVEAMAAGTPVVVPDNTCMSEHIGKKEQRGYMYPCNDLIWVDNSGYRKKGLIPDIVNKMLEVYKAGAKVENPKVDFARQWAETLQWSKVGEQWVQLFKKAETVTSIVSLKGLEV